MAITRSLRSDVPEGYTIELFGGDHCANLECNLATSGTIITIVGGGLASGKDIALDYSGTRLLGTITRSDSGAPVSSLDAHVSADLYDAAGDFIGDWPTNRAGQYQIHLAGAGSYYLVAVNDWDNHGLINEAWDDIKCSHNCDPLDNGATLIPVAEGTTVVADFVLDPSFIISGTIQFEGSPTGEGYVNIWDERRSLCHRRLATMVGATGCRTGCRPAPITRPHEVKTSVWSASCTMASPVRRSTVTSPPARRSC